MGSVGEGVTESLGLIELAKIRLTPLKLCWGFAERGITGFFVVLKSIYNNLSSIWLQLNEK